MEKINNALSVFDNKHLNYVTAEVDEHKRSVTFTFIDGSKIIIKSDNKIKVEIKVKTE